MNNMHILQPSQVTMLKEKILNRIPCVLLKHVALSEPTLRVHITRHILGLFPKGTNIIDADDIAQLIEWFQERGDLASEPGRRIRCAPPHVIGTVNETRALELMLYGNPLIERNIKIALEPYGGKLIHRNVTISMTKPISGLVRTLVIPANIRERTIERIQCLGLAIFDIRDLITRLPSITDFILPYREHFSTFPPAVGVWQEYNPRVSRRNYQAGRWCNFIEWESAGTLVRLLRPGERYQSSARYFLHLERELVCEISRDKACIWQFKIDKESMLIIPWIFYAKSRELVINGRLPVVYAQILQCISGGPPTRDGFCYLYLVPTNQFTEANALGNHLGTVINTLL
jgi:hypothetical protein